MSKRREALRRVLRPFIEDTSRELADLEVRDTPPSLVRTAPVAPPPLQIVPAREDRVPPAPPGPAAAVAVDAPVRPVGSEPVAPPVRPVEPGVPPVRPVLTDPFTPLVQRAPVAEPVVPPPRPVESRPVALPGRRPVGSESVTAPVRPAGPVIVPPHPPAPGPAAIAGQSPQAPAAQGAQRAGSQSAQPPSGGSKPERGQRPAEVAAESQGPPATAAPSARAAAPIPLIPIRPPGASGTSRRTEPSKYPRAGHARRRPRAIPGLGADGVSGEQALARKGVCFAYFIKQACWRVPEAYCNTALQVCITRECPVYRLHRDAMERRFATKFKHFW